MAEPRKQQTNDPRAFEPPIDQLTAVSFLARVIHFRRKAEGRSAPAAATGAEKPAAFKPKARPMNKLILNTIDMGDRIVEFGKKPSLALTVPITALFAQAETKTDELKTAAAEQSAGEHARRGGSAECKRLAREVRVSMRDIAEIAKILKSTDLSGAAELFRMPRNVAYQKLVAAARGFATTADTTAHKAAFIAKGLPATFVTDLTALIDTFETAVALRANGRNELVASTAGLRAKASALLEIAQELRAVMRVHLKGQPDLIESFRTAARVHRIPTASSGDGSGTTPPPVLPPAGS